MTLDEMTEIFDGEDEFLQFEKVENKRSKRPDLHAFLLLDELVPGNRGIVAAAEHDEFFIGVSPEDLAAAATKEQIVELMRCGVRYDSSLDSLAMFA